MKTPLLSHKRRLFIGPLVILVFSLVLSACDQGSGNRSSTVVTKPPVATATVPGILLGPQPCPAAIQAAAHWNGIVGTNVTKTVQGVVCGYLKKRVRAEPGLLEVKNVVTPNMALAKLLPLWHNRSYPVSQTGTHSPRTRKRGVGVFLVLPNQREILTA